ncbi:hypothetical protein JM18_001354 [Phytophthora kernoviae]|uniref:Uncharacterized protein n=2 Tax=Phytophthora kernoviae TaxID=325452 RepID=A0A8T0M787_9STRA|nr:hypothetical protein G195_005086 [Phytophthora kernoviae 00238/432]KAG2529634.1 hypothetical protein JM18_001354 [Phytophthora kernoviae]KAG2531124.1 hypothetical protein JM16_001218 [Phytophthora kernoviae]
MWHPEDRCHLMSYSHPNHIDFHTGSNAYCYPNTYQASPYTQAEPYGQEPQYPYAVPIDAPMAPPTTQEAIDYARPQTWRNMPQRQDSENPPLANIETAQRLTSLDNVPPPAYSDVAMAANASVAASAVTPVVNNSSERGSVSSGTSSATRSSVDAAVDTMWEARRAREKAEEEADQKLIDAVCKASLAEFNERERALNAYETESSQRSLKHQTSSVALQQAKSDAEQRKRAAMQTVIESKTRAQLMSEKAREATSMYEQKNAERLAKQAELESLKLREGQEAELRAVQLRKEEAIRKRSEAEQKAREAREKAEAMRHQAFQAASKVRANSRRQIETQLNQEEEHRQLELQHKLDEIEKNKLLARERKEAAAKKAEEARRRAEELRAMAEQARLGLKSMPTSGPTSSAA